MSGVSNGDIANENTFDDAFMARNGDTDTSGTVGLKNTTDPNSGAIINNAQRLINELADTDGVAGEGDPNRKVYASTNYISNGDDRKVAIEKLDDQLFGTQSDLETAQAQILDHDGRLTTIESNNSTFGGDKTFSNNVIVNGNFTVNGTPTVVNSTDMQVVDKNILVNKDGNDASAEGAGVDVQRTTDNGTFRFDSTLASKWKVGLLSAMYEIIVSGIAQTIAGIKSFSSGIKTDTIDEVTLNAGVTIDAVLIKDGNVDGRDVSADWTTSAAHFANTSNPHGTTKAQVGLTNVTDDAQLKRAANDFSSFTEKTTLVDDDVFIIEDSAASGAKKFVKKVNLGASGSGGGAVNLITNGDAEAAVASIFTPYADAAASRPVDGTGGSPNVTTSVTSTNPLTGNKSFLLTKDAANRQGEGWSVPFSVPLSMRAKVLQIDIDYIVNSGTFVAGSSTVDSDVIWYLYDITNSTLIEPSSIKLLSNSSSTSDKFRSTFQTSATGSSYRLIAHCATTSAAAYELKVEVYISPSVYVYGTPITDWQSYTPTINGVGTPASVNFVWRRVGDSIQILGSFVTGTVTAATAEFTLPNGMIANSGIISTYTYYGDWIRVVSTGSTRKRGKLIVGGGSSIVGITSDDYTTALGPASALAGNSAFGNTESVKISAFNIPITGWSSSVQMSDSTDTRIVAAQMGGAAVATTAQTPIIFPIVANDTHGAYNTSTGRYLVLVGGYFRVTLYSLGGTIAAGQFAYASVNGAAPSGTNSPRLGNTVNANDPLIGTGVVFAKSGDFIDIRPNVNYGSINAVSTASIERISGPSAIAASEKETVAAVNNSGQTFTSLTTLTGWTVEDNTHGSFNPTTGIWTCQSAGPVRLVAMITMSSPTSGDVQIDIWKNAAMIRQYLRPFQVAGSNLHTGTVVYEGLCKAGDTLYIRGAASSSTSLSANNRCSLSISRG